MTTTQLLPPQGVEVGKALNGEYRNVEGCLRDAVI